MLHPHETRKSTPFYDPTVELTCDRCGIPHVHVGDLGRLFSIPRLVSYLEALQQAILSQDVDCVPDKDRAAIAQYILDRHDEIQKAIDTLKVLAPSEDDRTA